VEFGKKFPGCVGRDPSGPAGDMGKVPIRWNVGPARAFAKVEAAGDVSYALRGSKGRASMNVPGFFARRAAFAVSITTTVLIWSSAARAEPFATVLGTRLDSDIPGNARFLDPNLVNPIGIAMSGGSPDWIANGGSGVATLYNTLGQPQTLVVSIPSPGNPTGGAAPTGDVFNIAPANTAFQVTDGVHTASALFMFATTGGTIVGWNPAVDPTGQFAGPNGVSTFGAVAVNHSSVGADYRGLAIANNGVATLLYAANFGQGTIDVFDEHFAPASLDPGAFKDPNLPAGFVPFNVQELGGHVFVTYAQKNGAGGGLIDEFNLDGTFVARIASNGPGGPLEAPWGLAIAPSSFGSLAGMLLVGNHGDGIIDVFDPSGNNALLAELADPAERLLAIPGLWGLAVGNGTNGGDSNSILFTAGINGGRDGMFGSLTPVLPGTPVGDFDFVAVGVPWPSSLAMLTTALIVLRLGGRRDRPPVRARCQTSEAHESRQILTASVSATRPYQDRSVPP